MNKDWSIGNKVYYFFHDDDCSLIWNVENIRFNEEEITSFDRWGNPRFDDGYVFKPADAIYRTKNEAIDAMIAHLNSLRDR